MKRTIQIVALLSLGFIIPLKAQVTFTAPSDRCLNAPNEVFSFSGDPIGGIYAGPGVIDLGTGFNYVFNPSSAGAGIHTLTYTLAGTGSASDDVEVYALPMVSFTALPDLSIGSGIQTGLSGGSPSGGVYSGPGVTDDNNGMTYSFDPSVAGIGIHTLTYTFTDSNTCTNMASDYVEVFNTTNVSFTAPADLCIDAGVQSSLSGSMPTGGVYSGPGVSDDNNGMTYSFDPSAAGPGIKTITYTLAGNGSASDDIEIFALPTVSMSIPSVDQIKCIDDPITAISFAGDPVSGTYSGPGVINLNNGISFSFNPSVAGVGSHDILYTFTSSDGCSNSASDQISVNGPTASFTALPDLNIYDGIQTGLGGGVPTNGIYSGPGVVDDGNGMTYSFNPTAAGLGTHSLTYTYTDNGGCSADASDDVVVSDSCATNLILTPAFYPLAGTYRANQSIQVQGNLTLIAGSSVTLSAPSISIQDSVNTMNGSTLTIDPVGCNN